MNYEEAKAEYQKNGIDTERAISALREIPISLNSWQLDDIGGWEHPVKTAPGACLGRPRTPGEMFADLDLAVSLIPGRLRLNVHALQGVPPASGSVDRDKLRFSHFRPWVDFAKRHGMGFDFNPSCFMHPLAAGGALCDVDPRVRRFWIRHAVATLRIADQAARALKSPVSWTFWTDAGKHDEPSDRLGPRRRLMESLDEVFRQAKVDPTRVVVCLESQNWGVGKECYAAGSQEFMSQYAAKHGFCCLLDMAHYNPMESVADKISAVMLFSGKVALHIARPVRHTCAHVSRLDDALRDVAREVVRIGPDKFLVALDYGDSSMNRIAGLVQGARNVQLALLEALLMPNELLARLQDEGRATEEFVLSETMKTLPLGAVYAEFCRRAGKPTGLDWLNSVLDHERCVVKERG